MSERPDLLEEIKVSIERWKYIIPYPLIIGLFSLLDIEIIKNLPTQKKLLVGAIYIFLPLIPVLFLLAKKMIFIMKNGTKYPLLLADHSKLKKEYELLVNNNQMLENSFQTISLLTAQLIRFLGEESTLEVIDAYLCQADIYIVTSRKHENKINQTTRCVLIDITDGYIQGFFSNPVMKENGIHFKCYKNSDPVFGASLQLNNRLRPTTVAYILTEKELK